MAFCNKFMSAVRRVMDKVDKVLGDSIAEITKYTKLVKDLGMSPEVQALLAIVDKGGKVNTFIEQALAEITTVTDTSKSLAEKLQEWLATATSETDFNKKIFNLASVASKISDTQAGNLPKPEHVYDAAVIARIIADK